MKKSLQKIKIGINCTAPLSGSGKITNRKGKIYNV